MWSQLIPLFRDRVRVTIGLTGLKEALRASSDTRGEELAQRLDDEILPLLIEDVPSLLRELPTIFLERRTKAPNNSLKSDVSEVFRLLEESARNHPPSPDSASRDDRQVELRNWLDAALRRPNSEKSAPAMPPPPSSSCTRDACVRMIRNEALAELRWRDWYRNFNQLTTDYETLRRATKLVDTLRSLESSLDKRLGENSEMRRGREQELDSLYAGVRLFAMSYRKSTEDLRKRLSNPSRHPLESEVFDRVDMARSVFSEVFPEGKVLLQLSQAWHDGKVVDQGEFLRQSWEQSTDPASPPQNVDPLKYWLLLDVCHYFDSLPSAARTDLDDSLILPLRRFAKELGKGSGWEYRLVISDADCPDSGHSDSTGEIERVEASDVACVRRESTGIVLMAGDEQFVARKARWRIPTPMRRLVDSLSKASRELERHDSLLSQSCRDLAEALAGQRTVADWLDARDSVPEASGALNDRLHRESKLWYVVHLANTQPRDDDNSTIKSSQPIRDQILRALEEYGGLSFEEGGLPESGESAPIWMLHSRTPTEPSRQGTIDLRTRQGLWITLPGKEAKRLPPPAIAMVVGEATECSLLWQRIQPFLAELKLRAPDDPLWTELDEPFLRGLLNRASSEDREAALGVFERIYAFAKRSTASVRVLTKHVLAVIRKSLESPDNPIVPRLDVETLSPLPVARQPVGKLRLAWRIDDAPAGTIVEVVRFGTADRPAEAIASGGPSLPDFAAEYFAIPASDQPDELERRLEADREDLALNARDAVAIVKDVEASLLDAVGWIEKCEDMTVLNSWLTPIVAGVDAATTTTRGRWCKLLYGRGKLRTFPSFDPANGTVQFPTDGFEVPSGVVWEFSDLPLGAAVDATSVMFSVHPGGMSGRFSMGPKDEENLLSKCDALRQMADAFSESGKNRTLATILRGAASKARDLELRHQLGAPPSSLKPLFESLVESSDGLVKAEDCDRAELDRAWRLLGEIARRWKGNLVPEDFSFSNPDSTSHPVELAFHEADAKTGTDFTLGVELANLKRDCRLVRYVGPAPIGWHELCDAHRRLPDSIRDSVSALLKEWPRSYLKRGLIQRIVELYMLWFDRCRPMVIKTDSMAAKEMTDALIKAVKGQRLQLFMVSIKEPLPANRAKYIEFTHEVSGGPSEGYGQMVVKEILRPGIRDESNEPLCKARVIMKEATP